MTKILSLEESADAATEAFQTFGVGTPDLIRTGMGPLDRALGGLCPGNTAILGAFTGVGKSSIILTSAIRSGEMVGIVSLEDTPDVWGARAIAYQSGIDSLRLRRKDLSAQDRDRIRSARDGLAQMTIRVAYCVGSQLYEIQEAIKSLQQAGCRIVWIDYVQKIRGSRDDRRNDVSSSFSALHRQCYELDLAAIFVSQFSRQPEPGRQPKVHWLKESGDLENEARVIVLCQRDARDSALVHARVAKSTYGGEGVTWYYRRDDRGNLMEDDDMPRVAIP